MIIWLKTEWKRLLCLTGIGCPQDGEDVWPWLYQCEPVGVVATVGC